MERLVSGVDFGPAIRDACVQQWLVAGYPLFSVNSEAELPQLRKLPVGAEFLSNGTAMDRTGVSLMVQLAIRQKVDVAIITNADCLVLDMPKLKRVVASVEPDSICLLERLNIDQKTLRTTGQHCAGFDAFIVGAKALEFMNQTSTWKIGDTWWDYWFPISILLAGGRLRTCVSPLLLHINHPLGWDFEKWKQNGERFTRDVWSKDFSAVGEDFREFFIQQRTGKLNNEKLSAIGDFTFDWLKKNARPIDSVPQGTIEDLKNRILSENAWFNSPANSRTIHDANSKNAVLSTIHPLSLLKRLVRQK